MPLVLALTLAVAGFTVTPTAEAERASAGIAPYTSVESVVAFGEAETLPDAAEKAAIVIPVEPRVVRTPVQGPTARPSAPAVPSMPSAPAQSAPEARPAPAAQPTDKLSQARAILASRIAMYPILQGSTVELGNTQGNPQAIVYYQSGRIIINPNHTASLERILDHEIWHIIDWRDNGRIDWGENVPPKNAADYRG